MDPITTKEELGKVRDGTPHVLDRCDELHITGKVIDVTCRNFIEPMPDPKTGEPIKGMSRFVRGSYTVKVDCGKSGVIEFPNLLAMDSVVDMLGKNIDIRFKVLEVEPGVLVPAIGEQQW